MLSRKNLRIAALVSAPPWFLAIAGTLVGVLDPLNVLHTDEAHLCGIAGLLLGAVLGGLLLQRQPRAKRPLRLIDGAFGGACLATLGAMGPAFAVFLIARGPLKINPDSVIREVDYARVQGEPDLGHLWAVKGGGYRFPLKGFHPSLLVQTVDKPNESGVELAGEVRMLWAGGRVGGDLFVSRYAEERQLRGSIYLLDTTGLLKGSPWRWFVPGIISFFILMGFAQAQRYG